MTVDVSERVRALRERVGLTQAEVGERAGLERVEVNQIERGKNAASSWRVRAGLARAFGVQVVTLSAYLDCEIDLDAIVARIAEREADLTTRGTRPISSRSDWPVALSTARTAAAVTDPDLSESDLARVGQMFDGPALPAVLTPRLILQLARALKSA